MDHNPYLGAATRRSGRAVKLQLKFLIKKPAEITGSKVMVGKYNYYPKRGQLTINFRTTLRLRSKVLHSLRAFRLNHR